MLSIDTDPAEKELRGDTKGFAQVPDRLSPQEICSKSLKDEKQGILAIRNNEIRKNGMGMAASFALDPADAHQTLPYVAINAIDQKTFVESEETAVPRGTAGRADFFLGNKSLCKSREYRFCV